MTHKNHVHGNCGCRRARGPSGPFRRSTTGRGKRSRCPHRGVSGPCRHRRSCPGLGLLGLQRRPGQPQEVRHARMRGTASGSRVWRVQAHRDARVGRGSDFPAPRAGPFGSPEEEACDGGHSRWRVRCRPGTC